MERKQCKELLQHIRHWQEDLEEWRWLDEEEVMLAEQHEQEALRQEECWRRLAEEQQAQHRFKLCGEEGCKRAQTLPGESPAGGGVY